MKKFILGIILSIFSFGILTAQDNPVHWSFSSKIISDCEYELTFKAKIDEPWHLYSLNIAGDEGPNPTVYTFKKDSDYELIGKVKQGKPLKEFDKVFELNVEYYKHDATFTQRIKLLTDKKIKITGKYEYQACTEEKCTVRDRRLRSGVAQCEPDPGAMVENRTFSELWRGVL